jgi:SAM-dependent methyltransferase
MVDPRLLLTSLPRLRRDSRDTKVCKICASEAPVFDIVDFNKWCSRDFYAFGLAGIPVTYHRCSNCSFVFTTFFDSWSAADFSQFVYNDDYVIVDPDYALARPAQMAAALSALLEGCETKRILDYGSGSGHFAAEMASRGFEGVTSYDQFSAPARPQGKFDVITCFETIEHTVDPLGTIGDMKELLADDGAIIIGTGLQPPNIDEIRGNWWYIGPRNGHISIFAEDTFSVVADSTGLALRLGAGLYWFVRPSLSDELLIVLARLGPIITQRVQLFAPEAEDENWNGFEILRSNIRFRWTRLAESRGRRDASGRA